MAAKKKEIKIQFVGKNTSYTVNKIRFDKKDNVKVVDAETAERLIKTGKFVDVDETDIDETDMNLSEL